MLRVCFESQNGAGPRRAANAPLQKELGIHATAYGTRWYLTLFNYSIPFPAQLRVWDVFMLLGDPDLPDPHAPAPAARPAPNGTAIANGGPTDAPAEPSPDDDDAAASFRGGLDVLHATAAALIDGLREILLDSDFENAMKVLTSWVPVRDEELLMRVAKAEWKSRARRRKEGGAG